VKRWFKRIVYILVGLALLGLLIWAFVPEPVDVDVARVDRGLLQITVDEEGKTRIRERYVIASPLEGQMGRVKLDAGDSVDAGKTVLVSIKPKDPALLDPRARAEAQARLEAAEARQRQTEPLTTQAEAELQIAHSEYHRLLELPRGNVATQEVEDARLAVAARQAALRSAQIARDIARYEAEVARAALIRAFPTTAPSDENIELTSPITGKVLRVIKESSMPVMPGTEIIEVGDPRDLEVEMEVLSTEAVKVTAGDRVQFVRWGGGDPINGVVRLIEPQAFTKISALGVEEQRVRIICDLTDPPQRYQSLGDWYRVDGRIIVWQDEDALIVPTSALFREGQQWQVFVVRDGRAQLRDVTIGHMSGLAAQVLQGLEPGDVVVVHPSDQVAAKVRVNPRR
jgi:HlyD family secretion protein